MNGVYEKVSGQRYINVQEVRADSNLYEMGSVTGVDVRVLAVVASQLVTAEALLEALNRIERYDYTDFAFVCHGEMHCSVACCILLAAIAYPEAIVCLSTRRTQQAAEARGFVEVFRHWAFV